MLTVPFVPVPFFNRLLELVRDGRGRKSTWELSEE
jgi:hypothetical protein